MALDEATQGWEGTYQRGRAHTKDISLNLGDLRELVRITDGMNDRALVSVTNLSQHGVLVGECLVKTLWVRDEQVN